MKAPLGARSLAISLFTLGALVTGCAVTPETDEAADEASAAASSGIAEETRAARGLLRFVNGASKADLDAVRPRLSRSVIDRILAFRAGGDAQLGTADDKEFSTVAALDAIPGVGPAILQRLLAAADAAGYLAVDEFSPDWCEGPALTADEAATMLSGRTAWMPVDFARARFRVGGGEWQNALPEEPVLSSPKGHLRANEILGRTQVRFYSSTFFQPRDWNVVGPPPKPIFQMQQLHFRREYCYPQPTSPLYGALGGYTNCIRPLLDFHATLDFNSGLTNAFISNNPIRHNDPYVQPYTTDDSRLLGSSTLRVTRSCYQFLSKWTHPNYFGKEIEVSIGGTIPQ